MARYRAKRGYRKMSNRDAQILGDLHDSFNGILTAKQLVDMCRADDAPLHHLFEWDDAIAAELHREQQARLLLNSYEEAPEDEDAEGKRGSAAFSPEVFQSYLDERQINGSAGIPDVGKLGGEASSESETDEPDGHFFHLRYPLIEDSEILTADWLLRCKREAIAFGRRWAKERAILENRSAQLKSMFHAADELEAEAKEQEEEKTSKLRLTRRALCAWQQFREAATPSQEESVGTYCDLGPREVEALRRLRQNLIAAGAPDRWTLPEGNGVRDGLIAELMDGIVVDQDARPLVVAAWCIAVPGYRPGMLKALNQYLDGKR
jgi:hypothetical protein